MLEIEVGIGSGMLIGVGIAFALVIYALLLKVIDRVAGVSTWGYYILFCIFVFVAQIYASNSVPGGMTGLWRLFLQGVSAVVVASFLYCLWVVINTRVLEKGPIPQLRTTHKSLEERAASGEDVAKQLEKSERLLNSPELFALNVFLSLTILFIPIVTVLTLLLFIY